MEILELPIPSEKHPNTTKAVHGLRLCAIVETVDLIDSEEKGQFDIRKMSLYTMPSERIYYSLLKF